MEKKPDFIGVPEFSRIGWIGDEGLTLRSNILREFGKLAQQRKVSNGNQGVTKPSGPGFPVQRIVGSH